MISIIHNILGRNLPFLCHFEIHLISFQTESMIKALKSGVILCLLGLIACVPESKKIMTQVNTNVLSQEFQSIHDHQYTHNLDSLYHYLRHEDPTYRFLAARAFASIQSDRSLDTLYQMLDDPIIKVRSMAAYAIGQNRNPASEAPLLNGFRQRDTMSVDNESNAAIIEAIGKLGSAELPKFLIDASGYRSTDTLLHKGRIKSLYQFALNRYSIYYVHHYLRH